MSTSLVLRKIIQSALCCLPLTGCARAGLYYARASGDPVAQGYQAYLQGVAAGLSGAGPEIESYRRAGYFLGVLWSKARLSLKRAGADAADGHN